MAEGPALGTAYLRVAGDFSQLNSQMVGITSANRWGKLGKAAGVALAGGLAAAGVAKGLYEVGEAFDDAYDKIRTQTGRTGKDLKRLQQDFRIVLKGVPTDFETASDAVAGLNQRLDITGKPLRRLSKQFTELSRITETDVKENIAAVTRAFGDWEIKTRKQGEQLDRFFRASQMSGASVSDLAQQVVQFGAPLRQVGFTLDEATAMFAAFEEAGVNTQTMMPGLRMALKNFLLEDIDPRKGLQKAFADIESGTMKTSDALTLFGQRAGADMVEAIKQGRFELDEMTKAVKRGDDTVRQAGRETMDFSEHWQKFKNFLAVELEPVATRVFDTVGELMKDVSKAFRSGGLEGVVDLITKRISDAIPKMLELGGKLARELVGGFLNSGIWGKVALGAVLFKMLGGVGTVRAATAAGTTMSSRFAGGFKAGLKSAGITAVIVGVFEAINRITKGFSGEVSDTVARTLGPRLESAIQRKSIPALRELREQFNTTAKIAEAFGDEVPENVQEGMARSARAMDRLMDTEAELRQDIRKTKITFADNLKQIQRSSEENMAKIERSFGTHSAKGRDLVRDNLQATIKAVKRAMDRQLVDVEKGQRMINDAIRKQMKTYGLSDDLIERQFNATGNATNGGASGLQRGGPINAGKPTGDSVPALLERGEYVLNRKAVAQIGTGVLDKINFGLARRFATGGAVGGLKPGISSLANQIADKFGLSITSALRPGDPGFHGQGLAADISNGSAPTPEMNAASRYINATPSIWQRLLEGIYSGSPHLSVDSGQKVSPSFWGGSTWGAHGNHLHLAIADSVGKLKGAGSRLKIKLPRFSSKFAAHMASAEGLNITAEAMEKKLRRVIARETVGDHSDVSFGPGAAVKTLPQSLRKWNKQYPYDSTATMPSSAVRALASWQNLPGWFWKIAIGESAMQPGAVGHDPGGTTGYGLYQETDPFANAYVKAVTGGLDYKKMLNPVLNTMAAKLHFNAAPSQTPNTPGFPWYGTSGLQLGGIIEKLRGGGKPGRKKKPDKADLNLFGQTTATGAQGTLSLPDKMLRKIRTLRGITPKLEEQVNVATTLASFLTSPAGSDLSEAERQGLIGLNTGLLGNLTTRAGLLSQGVNFLPRKSKLRQRLTEELAEVAGPLGTGGQILTVREVLDALGARPDTGGESETQSQIAALERERADELSRRLALLNAQIPVFDRVFSREPFGGTFHNGGVVPGPIGANRTIVAQGGETVLPIGAGGDTYVAVIVEDGAVDAGRIKQVVGSSLEEVVRKAGHRGGVAGRKAVWTKAGR